MSEFNFKSQPYTTIEQSQRLIALGLKVETADCCHWFCISCVDEPIEGENIPAWSLHRLIEMMPSVIYREGRLDYYLNVNRDGVIYDRMGIACIEYIYDNLFDNIVLCIEWLIKEGYFNKEYLQADSRREE